MTKENDAEHFWSTFLRAVGTEPARLRGELKGSTGIVHPYLAMGTDATHKRAVLISAESDARTAVLVQSDLQLAYPQWKWITARPVPINLACIAADFSGLIGGATVILGPHWDQLSRILKAKSNDEILSELTHLSRAVKGVSVTPLSGMTLLELVAQQLAHLRLRNGDIDIERLLSFDPLSMDRFAGTCAVPLYEFTQEETELFLSGKDADGIVELLRRRQIYQYFYPPPDQLALGIAESNPSSSEVILDAIGHVEAMGHPPGEMELVSPHLSPKTMIEELKERKMLVEEVEHTIELGPDGLRERMKVRGRPQEGLLQMLFRRLLDKFL